MCADGRRGSHPQSDCGRKVLLSSLQRMCMLRDKFLNSKHSAVLRLRWDQTSNGA